MEGVPDADSASHIEYEHLQFEQQIGKGSFGTVWRGNYLGTPVAIKSIPKSEDLKEEIDIFVARERAMTRFAHPHLVQFVGVADHGADLFLVTEFVAGGDLRRYLKDENQEIGWRLRVQIASDICRAMVFLHARNIMHRDLKSKNLLVDNNWKIKVCDFGFARTFEPQRRPYTICGTEDWMAPELILGMEYDCKVDVFSFGIVLCEIITRKKMSVDLKRSPQQAFSLDPEQLMSLAPPECPKELIQIALHCCEYNPELRPPFRDVLRSLNDLQEDLLSKGTTICRPGTKPVIVQEPEKPQISQPVLEEKTPVVTPTLVHRNLTHKFKKTASFIKKDGVALHAVDNLTSLTFPEPQEFYAAMRALTLKTTAEGWVLLGYKSDRALCFQGKGTTVPELVTLLRDNEAQYAFVRVPVAACSTGSGKGLSTSRDVFLAWLGPKLGQVSKGKKASHVGEVKNLLRPFHAEITVVNSAKLTLKSLVAKSDPLSGSHVIDELTD